MSWLRLVFRLQRFELIAIGVAVAVWTVAAFIVAARLNGYIAENPICFGLTNIQTPADAKACSAAAEQFGIWDQTAEMLQWITLAFPLVGGVVLGVPIVAREIEHQTAQTTWSLTLSRPRWLAARSWPILAALLLILTVAAVVAEYVTVTRLAGSDPGFQHYDKRGLFLPTRGIFAFAVAVLVGVWLGRTLPAILVALTLSATLVFGLGLALGPWRVAEAQVVQMNSIASDSVLVGGLILEPVAILPDGTVTSERHADRLPAGTNIDFVRVIPSAAYWTWVARESLLVLGLGAAAAALAGVAIRHRRPS